MDNSHELSNICNCELVLLKFETISNIQAQCWEIIEWTKDQMNHNIEVSLAKVRPKT